MGHRLAGGQAQTDGRTGSQNSAKESGFANTQKFFVDLSVILTDLSSVTKYLFTIQRRPGRCSYGGHCRRIVVIIIISYIL